MTTLIYDNWVAKVGECGFTNEQACGLAMIYAWSLTLRKSADDVPDTASFWLFVEKDDFDQLTTQFNINDFVNFVPTFKMAGDVLRVDMRPNRTDSDGNPAKLLNLDWPNEIEETVDVQDRLMYRHRFDMYWCQRAGESMREEIRTPRHAYALVSYVAHGFQKYDPEGFVRILEELMGKRSPLVSSLTSVALIKHSEGLNGYEPVQLALQGFMDGTQELSEQIWNLQRTLFYKHPDGTPINADKQFLPTDVFIEFADSILSNFISVNRTAYLNSMRLVASEYVFRRAGDSQVAIQLRQIMDERYKLYEHMSDESLPMRLLLNAVALFTLSCLHLKNQTNQIATLPSLRMADNTGVLWTRDLTEPIELRNEAFQCFNVMMSWRLGVASCLFLESSDGHLERVYVDGQSEPADTEKLFVEVCSAYQPVRAVLASFLSFPSKDESDGDPRYVIAFLNMAPDSVFGVDLFQCDASLEMGFHLGQYLGHSEDEKFRIGLCPKVQEYFKTAADTNDDESVKASRKFLMDRFPTKPWKFITAQ